MSWTDRLAELGMAVGVQPAFDAAWGGPAGMYARRLGPRRVKSMNPLADLWRRGVMMGGGSDANVTPLDPWHGIAAAVHHHRIHHHGFCRYQITIHSDGHR